MQQPQSLVARECRHCRHLTLPSTSYADRLAFALRKLICSACGSPEYRYVFLPRKQGN